jgi:hypothetical protein
MDKAKIIGELAKLKYFSDLAIIEVQKEASKETIKPQIDLMLASINAVVAELCKQ